MLGNLGLTDQTPSAFLQIPRSLKREARGIPER